MSHVLDRIKKQSVEVKTADALRDAIVSGMIPLGARLTEVSSADQLGVSRSTIRTAFHQLVQEGLLVQVPYTGWTVMTLDARDAWELYTLRASLEALAARLVAGQVAGDENAAAIRETLNRALDELASACRAHDADRMAATDVELHKSIVLLADHRLLAEQYALIEHPLQIYIRSSDALVAESDQLLAQHQPLVEALLLGDVAAAVSRLAAHIEEEGDILVRHLQEEESDGRGAP